MYSRYQDDPKRPVRLPEHYSGSAFSQRPTEPAYTPKREPSRPQKRNTIEEKVSPVADRLLRAEASEEKISDVPPVADIPAPPIHSEQTPLMEEDAPTVPEKEKPTGGLPINFSALRRLLGGEGDKDGEQDRLLLLGLILLLSRGQGDSDVLLWLSLLLLCG